MVEDFVKFDFDRFKINVYAKKSSTFSTKSSILKYSMEICGEICVVGELIEEAVHPLDGYSVLKSRTDPIPSRDIKKSLQENAGSEGFVAGRAGLRG